MSNKFNIENFLEDKNILYLSPHPDDLAYSNGGLIAKKLHFKEFTVVNVFTRSLWAPNIIETDAESISAIREEEDAKYCEAYQIKPINLGFNDSSCRGYDDIQELNVDPKKDPIFIDVEMAIKGILEHSQYDIIFCPLAIGNHIDHLMVFKVIKSVEFNSSEKIFYEDVPYCIKFTENEIERIINERLKIAYSFNVDIKTTISRKLEDMKVYASQTREEDLNAAYLQAKRRGIKGVDFCEKLWISS